MSKNNNRDDFSKSVKTLASERVGLRCSLCGILTKAAPKNGNSGIINIGIAAHICAAAPLGPRFDPNMTVEQRTSIDNCIWLCGNHAKLIDSDEKAYPKEFLILKKREAENKAAEALESGKSSFTIVQNCGFNLKQTKIILDETIEEGNFAKLQTLLESLESTSKSDDFQDLYDYYKIVYSFYCDRNGIKYLISKYITNKSKIYIDELTCLFAQFFDKELLSYVYKDCKNKQLKLISEQILNDTFESQSLLIGDAQNIENRSLEFEIDDNIRRIFTIYALNKHFTGIRTQDGEIMPYFDTEFYFQQRILLLKLYKRVTMDLHIKEQKLKDYDEFNIICSNLERIKLLTPELQTVFWEGLLSLSNLLGDESIYERLYTESNQQIRENLSIKEMDLGHRLRKNAKDLEFSEIRQFCEISQKYSLAHNYFYKQVEENPQKGLNVIEMHNYLYHADSLFLEDYIMLNQANKSSNFSPISFLNQYKNIYNTDYVYHLLLAYYSSTNIKYNKIFKKESEWVAENLNSVYEFPISIISKLIYVFNKSKKFSKLLELNKRELPIFFRLEIVNVLIQETDYLNDAKIILLQIKQENPKLEIAYRGLFICCYHLGEIADAKKYILEALMLKQTKENYRNLLSIRLETQEIIFDKFFEEAKNVIDAQVFYLIGVTYLQAQKKENAYEYLLRSLLIDDTNVACLNAFISITMERETKEKPKSVQAGVTAILKDESGAQTAISLYKDELIGELETNNLANSEHYKESDRKVEKILYKSAGAIVEYKGTNYEIISLDWIDNIISGYAMSVLLKNNLMQVIKGDSTNNGIENLIKWVEQRQCYVDDIISIYNESKGILPITLFSAKLGRKILESYSFLLYENKKRLRNLENEIEIYANNEFVLSFDSIYILAILGINIEDLKGLNCNISVITRRFLLSEISDIINELKDTNRSQLLYRNGQVVRTIKTEENAQEQIKFLYRIKRLVEGLTCLEKEYSYSFNDKLRDFFVNKKLFLESDMIGAIAANDKAILVSDDTFISNMMIRLKLKQIGMNKFLTLLGLNIEKHIDYIQKLSYLNFGNYFTSSVYRFIKQGLLLEGDRDRQQRYIEKLHELLTSKFIKTNKDLVEYNNSIVQNLGIEVIKKEQQDYVDQMIIRAVVNNYAKSHPEEYRNKVKEIINRTRMRTVEKDGKLYIEWYEI